MSKLPTPKTLGQFDSGLEFSWDSLLYSLQLLPFHHPYELFLPLHNQYYEPDFSLTQPIPESPEYSMELLLEAKAHYHQNRLYKPYSAAKSYSYPVTLLLPPYIPQDPAYNHLELPWADWKPIHHPYVLLRPSYGFIPPSLAEEGDYVPGTLYYSLSDSLKEFFKPLDFKHYSLIDSSQYEHRNQK